MCGVWGKGESGGGEKVCLLGARERREEKREVRSKWESCVGGKARTSKSQQHKRALAFEHASNEYSFPLSLATNFYQDTIENVRQGLTKELAHRTHPHLQETARVLHVLSPIRVPLELPALLRVDVLEVLCLEARPSLYNTKNESGGRVRCCFTARERKEGMERVGEAEGEGETHRHHPIDSLEEC